MESIKLAMMDGNILQGKGHGCVSWGALVQVSNVAKKSLFSVSLKNIKKIVLDLVPFQFYATVSISTVISLFLLFTGVTDFICNHLALILCNAAWKRCKMFGEL